MVTENYHSGRIILTENKKPKKIKLSTDFFKTKSSIWNNLEDNRNRIIENLKVINNRTERGIRLIKIYHEKVPKNKEQKQHLFKAIVIFISVSI